MLSIPGFIFPAINLKSLWKTFYLRKRWRSLSWDCRLGVVFMSVETQRCFAHVKQHTIWVSRTSVGSMPSGTGGHGYYSSGIEWEMTMTLISNADQFSCQINRFLRTHHAWDEPIRRMFCRYNRKLCLRADARSVRLSADGYRNPAVGGRFRYRLSASHDKWKFL